MASIFRSVCSYPHLAREVIPISADHTPDHDLAAGARQVLDGIYAAEIGELSALYEKRKSQGRAPADLALAARAATFGAVDTLIVDMEAEVPGSIGEDDGKVTFAEQADGKNYGVTDEIARRAWTSARRVLRPDARARRSHAHAPGRSSRKIRLIIGSSLWGQGPRLDGLAAGRQMCVVSIPPNREVGSVQWPAPGAADPARDFALVSETAVAPADLSLSLARLTPKDGRVLVYVHGFNTRFDAAVFNFAQLVHDTCAPVAPVLFSWPSGGCSATSTTGRARTSRAPTSRAC